jgi:hypothetical protein
MMDDVVGLIMVQVISNLGGENFSWVTVVRPVLVSVAFAAIVPLVCLFVVKPSTLSLNRYRKAHPLAAINALLGRTKTVFVIHTLLLVGLVTGATYAGTSNLFAAYIAGACISWWDSEVLHAVMEAKVLQNAEEKDVATVSLPTAFSAEQPSSVGRSGAAQTARDTSANAEPQSPRMAKENSSENDIRGLAIYKHYYHPAVSKILQPLFFASVGFSIPITKMFRGSIVWRGIVYTILMAVAKMICGLWLVRFSGSPVSSKGAAGRLRAKLRLPSFPHFWGKSERATSTAQAGASHTVQATTPAGETSPGIWNNCSSPNPPKPLSLHPPLILALAMCARGEIGFLISGVAEANGVFSATGKTSREPSEIFLVVTWAIVLCTIIGPLGVGLSVRRVRELQERKNRQQEGAGRDVLGVWGVE